MPNYTENLQLEQPLDSEQYDVAVTRRNNDKIDQFAGQVPARALTADKLTTGAKINGVNFKGDADIVTGAGFYYDTVTYGAGDLVFIYNQDGALELHKSLSAGNVGHNPLTSTGYWEKQDLGGSGGRNVGEIIQSSLPLTDAGLHLLDGTRLSGDGIYKEFVNYIADLYDSESPTITYEKDSLIALPTFTSNTQDGITITDARNNTTTLQAIFNGTNQTNLIGLWSTYWISIDYRQNTILDSYTIQADNTSYPEFPSDWVVQGSNDGSTWVNIDSRTGITFSLNEIKTFTVLTSTPYKQYKIVFSNGVEASSSGEIKQFKFNAYTPIAVIENSIFVTEAQWQQSITDYGSCGKFVYDSTLNTVRLPKVTGIIEGTTNLSALGDLVEAGLPNITGEVGTLGATGFVADGAFYWTRSGGPLANDGQLDAVAGFDASRSSSIYGNSSTVQPQTIKVLYYIVIATSTKTDIEVDIDEIATDLNGKADVDLSNANNQAKILMSGMAMPSDTYIDLTLGATNSTYTAPANGWVVLTQAFSDACYLGVATVYSNKDGICMSSQYNAWQVLNAYIPVSKGETFKVFYGGTMTSDNANRFQFIYAVGSESEAS